MDDPTAAQGSPSASDPGSNAHDRDPGSSDHDSGSDSDGPAPPCRACGRPLDDHVGDDGDGGDETDADAELECGGAPEWKEGRFPSLYAAVRAGDVEGAREVYERYLERQHQPRLSAALAALERDARELQRRLPPFSGAAAAGVSREQQQQQQQQQQQPELVATARAEAAAAASASAARFVELCERLCWPPVGNLGAEQQQQQQQQEARPGDDDGDNIAAAPPPIPLHAPGGRKQLTPLMLAAKMGDAEMVRAIGRMDPALDEASEGSGGLNALALALVGGHAGAVTALLEVGADPNAPLKLRGFTSLHAGVMWLPQSGPSRACEDRRDAALGALLRGASAESPPQPPRLQPQPQPPQPLSRRSLDLEVQDDADGHTPFLLALWQGRLSAARMFLEHGACALAIDGAGRSALSLLMHGALSGHARSEEAVAQMAAALLDLGVPVHPGFGANGDCPVFLAALLPRPALLRLLLDAPGGAEAVRARSPRDGCSVLHYACGGGDDTCAGGDDNPVTVSSHVRLLLERGADRTAIDDDGRVPAFDAIGTNDEPALRLLLDGAPLSYASSGKPDGCTLLMHAAHHQDRLPCLHLLLRSGADACAVMQGGSEGNKSAVDVLLGARLEGLVPSWGAYQRAMVALLSVGCPVGNPHNARRASEFLPAALRVSGRRARRHAARTAVPSRQAEEREEMVGLAMDMRELREAEDELAAKKARLRALEEAEPGGKTSGAGGSGESGDGGGGGSSEDEGGSGSASDEDEMQQSGSASGDKDGDE